jgi:hypothetical protein
LDRVTDSYPVHYRAPVPRLYLSPELISIDTRRGARIHLSKPAHNFLDQRIGDIHIRAQ